MSKSLIIKIEKLNKKINNMKKIVKKLIIKQSTVNIEEKHSI